MARTSQTDARPPEEPRPRAGLRALAGRQLWPLLELFVLAGFAVAQPLLDVIGRSPDFLLFLQADAKEIALLAFTITFGPPLVLWGLELLAGLAGRRVQRAVHLALVGGLMAVLGLEVAKKLTPLRGPGTGRGGGCGRDRSRRAVRQGVGVPAVAALRLTCPAGVPARVPAGVAGGPAAPAGTGHRPAGGRGAAPRRRRPGRHHPAGQAAAAVAARPQRPDRPAPVPNFAKLAGQSTWYRNATGVSGLTNWAMPAMFTGRYPAKDVAPIAARYPNNLFRLLGGSGYDMRVFEGITQLCPPGTCAIQASPGGQGGFRRVARDSARLWTEISSPRDSAVDPTATLEEDTVDPNDQAATGAPKARQDPTWVKRPASLDGFLADLRPTGGPSVHFLHILLPHQPWRYLPSGLKYRERPVGEGLMKEGRWSTERWPVQSTHQRHLMQTAYTDRLLGTIVKQLRTTGLYDRSLLLVTADHGLAFTPGEESRSTVTEGTAPDVLWVPLFIKRPGQQDSSVNDVNFEHVDLAPTISELAGLKVPWATDGVSWADPSKPMRQRTEKWFYPRPGEQTVVEGSRNRAIALQGLSDQVVRVGDDYLDWFKLGPSADLVGRRVGDLAVGAGGGTARVIGLNDYRRIDPSSGQVPAQVGGQLTRVATGLPARPAVAVALNGVITGMSETFTSGDDSSIWFSTMASDSLMRRGENRLELFLVDTTGGPRRLRPLTLTS